MTYSKQEFVQKRSSKDIQSDQKKNQKKTRYTVTNIQLRKNTSTYSKNLQKRDKRDQYNISKELLL